MRRGTIFRRCSKCGAKVDGKHCTCGNERALWAFRVDVAAPGEPRKRHKQGGFKTKTAAIDAMTRLQQQRADGVYVEPSKQTLGDYLNQWLAARDDLRPNTRRDYCGSIERHIIPRIGDAPLQSLTSLKIKGFYQQVAASGKKGLSPKSIHNIHICLRAALGDAFEDGLIRKNPADRAHAKPKDRPEMLTWSGEELAAFLSFTAQDRDFPLYQLAAATGMRRGELLGLRWRDVDLEGGRLSIRQQVTRQADAWGFGPPKSAKSKRSLDLDADTVAILCEQRERQLFERRRWDDAYHSDLDLVLCREDGSPEDPDVVGRRFSRRVAQVKGLPKIGLHGLRHTHATLLLEDGVDVKTVSERLGHDSIQTTLELYAHVTPRMRASAAARFGALLGRAQGIRAQDGPSEGSAGVLQ
jgi:integrase